MRWHNWGNILTKSCSGFAPKGTQCILHHCKILWKAQRASTEMVELAGTKKPCLDWNVNKFFIPIPKVSVHTVLKELLITFTTRSRMTNENFRLCGSLPLFFEFTPHVFQVIVRSCSISGWAQLVIYEWASTFIWIYGVFRSFRVCSGWKANRAYGKSPYLKIASKCAVGRIAYFQESCGYKHF